MEPFYALLPQCILPVALLAFVVISYAAWMKSTLSSPNWFSDRLFPPVILLWSLCRINFFISFPIVSNRHVEDEVLLRSFAPFLRRTNLCFFQFPKNFSSWRQEVKASKRVSGYTIITSLRISFGTPSIPGSLLAFSLLPALLSSSNVKISPHWTVHKLRWSRGNYSTRGNRLWTICLTWSRFSRPGVSLIVNLLLRVTFDLSL